MLELDYRIRKEVSFTDTATENNARPTAESYRQETLQALYERSGVQGLGGWNLQIGIVYYYSLYEGRTPSAHVLAPQP